MGARRTLAIDSPWAWLLCAGLALMTIIINPVGYIGGHNDDWRYLEAARCWVINRDICLATNHWEARWPAIAPIAIATSWFGEVRTAVGLAMLPAWIAAIVLTGWLGRLWVDRPTGLIAAAVLSTTPVFTQAALQPGVDTVELALQLATLVAATIAYQTQRRSAAFIAGLFMALAVQARDTSLLFCAVGALAWLALDRDRRRVLLWTVPSFGVSMLVELLAYWAATGDMLYRYHVALHHATIPSDELPAHFDTSQSPILNRAYIANWRREMEINYWWPIDPWVNLLASPRIGFTFIGAILLGAGLWRSIAAPVRRLFSFAIVLVAIIAIALVYGLAVDPKPRMFMLPATLAALFVGAAVSAGVRTGRGAVPLVIGGLVVAMGLVTLTRFNSTREFETLTSRWMSRYSGNLSLDPNALSTLALVPGVRAMPLAAGGRDYRIAGGNEPCEVYGGRVIDRSPVVGGGQLCLIKDR